MKLPFFLTSNFPFPLIPFVLHGNAQASLNRNKGPSIKDTPL